jgi:hypothetical protein
MDAAVQPDGYHEVGYLARQRGTMSYKDDRSVSDQIACQALPAMVNVRVNSTAIQIHALDDPFRCMNIESSENIIQEKHLGISINGSSKSNAGFLATTKEVVITQR